MARILLVDDEAATRDLVQRALKMDGHGVVATQQGDEALALLQSGGGFDLLVTDVQMPVMDGISLMQKAAAVVPGLRVILMSGYAEQLRRAGAPAGTVLRTVTKPFTLDEIRGEVNALLAA